MDPRRKGEQQQDSNIQEQDGDIEQDDAPELEEQDWDAVETGAILPDSIPGDEELLPDSAVPGDLPEEDDDNPYQNSDEALPDDEDEAAIARNPTKEGGLFDEI